MTSLSKTPPAKMIELVYGISPKKWRQYMPDKYCLSYNGLQLRIGIGHENSIWLTIDGYYIQEPPHLLLRELYNRIKNDAMQNPIAEDGIIKLLTK